MGQQASHAAESPQELAGKLDRALASDPCAQEHGEQFRIA
jgi:hypothetical protein